MASLYSSNLPALRSEPRYRKLYIPSHLLPIPSPLRPQGQRAVTPPTCRPPHLQAFSSPSTSGTGAGFLPINADYLSREFGGHGASFTALSDGRCAVRLGLDSGSTAGVLLPAGLVTSYKAQMWHGAALEVLQTVVNQEGDNGEVMVRGGVSLGLRVATGGGKEAEEHGNYCWSPSVWGLRSVRGSPDRRVQIELISVDPAGTAEITYVVTLDQALLGLELLVTNLTKSPFHLSGSLVGHLKVSTPEATYAVGLQGSSYRSYNTPPDPVMLPGSAAIVPPGFGQQPVTSKPVKGRGFGLFGWVGNGVEEAKDGDGNGQGDVMEQQEGEEKDNDMQMTRETCRVYTYAPRLFTVMDRGRRNSVTVERRGFEELYLLSPGSERHEAYGDHAFVAVGAAAVLQPIVLGPREVWAGGQYLNNPNM